MKKLKICPSCF